MILVRVGAPIWLSVIVISWGFVATLFAGLKTANEFYILRFLLGVAECGTFPGEATYILAVRFKQACRAGRAAT
jgi:ACS family tartrate transporter-like MFS transporter